MMRKFVIAVLLWSLAQSTAVASGFGWYVSAVDWGDLHKDTTGLTTEAQEVIATAQSSVVLQKYFQQRVDEELYNRYCNASGIDGLDLSPRYAEFYSGDFVKYAVQIQKGKRVKNSLFYLFTDLQPYVKIAPRDRVADELNPYFVAKPEELAGFLSELRAFNKDTKHPDHFSLLAMHLEAVFMLAASDSYPGTTGQKYLMQTALFFCGHD